MSFNNWLHNLISPPKTFVHPKRGRQKQNTSRQRYRPLLEKMEDRLAPATLNVTGFGVGGWLADDMRDDTPVAGVDLVGSILTHAGKPGQIATTADDLGIAQQFQFVAGPLGSTYGGAMSIDGTTSNSGKTNVSVIDTATGFAPASVLPTTFAATYQWYGLPTNGATVGRTLAFKIGVQSTEWAASQVGFTAIRSGESAWDLVLVHVPATSDNAWSTVNVDADTGTWFLFDQASNPYFTPPGNVVGGDKTLADWALDPTWGPILFGTGSKISSVQFGLGSSQRNCIAYVDYLQTNILNGGNLIDFGSVQNTYVDQAGDFTLNFDADNSSTVSNGDLVTWNGPAPVQNLTFGLNAFSTIQDGINGVAAGGTVNVAAGSYTAFGIDKGLTLFGPNATISPNTGTRVGEALVAGGGIIRISTTQPVVIEGLSLSGILLDSYTADTQITYAKNIIENLPGNMFFNAPDTFNLLDNHIYGTKDDWDVMLLAGDWNGTTGTVVSITGNVIDNTPLASGLNLSSVSGTISNNQFSHIGYYGVLLANDTNVTVSANTFENITNPDTTVPTWGAGVRFYTPGSHCGAEIVNNYFLNNYVGVGVRPGSDITGRPISISDNSFSGNHNNITHQGVGTLNAPNNWWGTTNGTAIAALISGPVNFYPFLTSGADKEPNTPGFQGYLDKTDSQPTVTINQKVGQADPVFTLAPINFTVKFSENVTGFTWDDVTVTVDALPASLIVVVTGSGMNYNVAVSGMTGPGTVTVSIAANKAQDGNGNLNIASTSTDNSVTVDLDETDCTGTIVDAAITTTPPITFKTTSQQVSLYATVKPESGGATVNEGTVTFIVRDGEGVGIGTPATGVVKAGSASAPFTLPAGTPVGDYVITAVYSGKSLFWGSTDEDGPTLTVASASTTTKAKGATTNFFFDNGDETDDLHNVKLTAAVTSSAGPVKVGTVTFTIVGIDGGEDVEIGPLAVVNGKVDTTYGVPEGTPAGVYDVQANYNFDDDVNPDNDNFLVSTGLASLVINQVKTTTTVTSAPPTTYNSAGGQTVILEAKVVSPAGTFTDGAVKFQVFNAAGVKLAEAVSTAAPEEGVFTADITLPEDDGLTLTVNEAMPVGSYKIIATFSSDNLLTSSDNKHKLTITKDVTEIMITSTLPEDPLVYSNNQQPITLSATVTGGTLDVPDVVSEGVVTFTVYSLSPTGSVKIIGKATNSEAVDDGEVTVDYMLPARMAAGTYNLSVTANYKGTKNFGASYATSASDSLTIEKATTAITVPDIERTFQAGNTVTISANVKVTSDIPNTNVNQGTVIFTITDDTDQIIFVSKSISVVNGIASTTFKFPAEPEDGWPTAYTITAVYSGSANFEGGEGEGSLTEPL